MIMLARYLFAQINPTDSLVRQLNLGGNTPHNTTQASFQSGQASPMTAPSNVCCQKVRPTFP